MKHLVFLSLTLTVLYSCGKTDKPLYNETPNNYSATAYVATPEENLPEGKNAIYGASFILAWQQIKGDFKDTVIVNGSDVALMQLNNSMAFKNTLKKGEYKTFTSIDNGEITVMAGFSKKLPFDENLESFKGKLSFKNTSIPSFGAIQNCYTISTMSSVKYYKDDNDFVLCLYPADEEHEILLYMTPEKGATMTAMFKEIQDKIKLGEAELAANKNYWKHDIMFGDEVLIPKLKLNIEEHYKNIEGSRFTTNREKYNIKIAKQQTIFSLDETGAIVKDAAYMDAVPAPSPPSEKDKHPKKLHFNKPFLVMIKRKDSPNPYFAMWVENTELMQKE
jgi:hypothetical protein